MREYRFLLTPQWFGWFGLAVLFAIVCGLLGHWQLDRRAETLGAIDRVETNYDHDPVPFATAAPLFDRFDAAQEWLPVRMTGQYVPGDTRIVRNRPMNGQPGFELLVPLRITDGADAGRVVVIDRGWLPIGSGGEPASVPAPPSGRVEVVARLKPAEGTVDRGAPPGQLASIDLTDYAGQVRSPIATGAYAQLAGESPAPATSPVAFSEPSLDEGPHLSYAMQWFAFGLLGFVGLGYAARQQAWINRNGPEEDEDIPSHLRGAVKRRPRRRTRRTAEDEEDDLLDAAGWR